MSVNMRKFTIVSVLFAALLCACSLVLPATATADDGSLQAASITKEITATDTGWYQDAEGHWCYWDAAAAAWLASQWLDTDTPPAIDPANLPAGMQRYWLDKDGNLAVSRVIDPGKPSDISDPQDALEDSYLAYATAQGCILKGGRESVGATKAQQKKGIKKLIYIADADGKLVTGNARGIYKDSSAKLYFIHPSAHAALVTTKPWLIEGFGYVFPCYNDGHLITGRKVIRPASGATVGSKVYLARPNGWLETGNTKAGGILGTNRYDKDKNGKPVKRYYYINQKHHCAIVASKPVKVANFGWVFPYDKYAHLITGRKVIKAKKAVYLARANGKLETGNKQGFLRTNAYNTKSKEKLLYYINPKTHAITYGKPVKVANFGWVYAPNGGGFLLTSCKKIDSKHMLLVEKNGRLYNKAGWVRSSTYTGWDDRFRMERVKRNGATFFGARIGYFNLNGAKYCGQSNGAVHHDQFWQLGNTYYWINHNGKFNRENVVTSLYRRAQGYWSPSRYLIMVDIDNPRTIVFEGWQGNWRPKFIWDCCTGHESCPTICGTFALGAKGYSFGEGNGYSCYYYSQICGDFLFHSQLYWPYTRAIKDGTMGRRCSHGCVRLYIDNAYWIWANVPSGTTVATVY